MTQVTDKQAQFIKAVDGHVEAFHAAQTPEEGAQHVLSINDLVLHNQFRELSTGERVQAIITNILKPETNVEKEAVHMAKSTLGLSGYGSP